MARPCDVDDEAPELWERQLGESDPAWAAFVVYRESGANERSVRETARKLDKSATLVGRWSANHHWVARVRAWDSHVDALSRQRWIDNRLEMVARHAELARLALTKVDQRLIGDPEAGVTAFDANDLTAKDLVRWMVSAAKLERQSRGVPTDIIQQPQATPQPRTWSDLDLIMEDEDLAAKAEDLAIEVAKARLRKEARGEI